MRRDLAVVGTDTGVGKTVVACGLIHALRQRGLRVAAFKPVETGLVSDRASDGTPPTRTLDGGPADWCRLAQETEGQGRDLDDTLGVAYALPAAPLAAAQESGTPLPQQKLTQHLMRLRHDSDLVVVEGAGGLLVPYTDGTLWADQVARWDLVTLLVGRLGLGTINHSLLSAEALATRAIPVAALVLNALQAPGPEAHHTLALIADFVDFPISGPLPCGATASQEVADWLERWGVVTQVLRLTCPDKID